MQAPSAPTSGDKLDLKTVIGALLRFDVAELVRDIETTFGKSDAVKCDVAILSGDRKGETLDDVLIFPAVLRNQLGQAIGSDDPVVLGRLGQGLAKPGKSAPWVLNAPTNDDFEIGQRYEDYIAKQRVAVEEPF